MIEYDLLDVILFASGYVGNVMHSHFSLTRKYGFWYIKNPTSIADFMPSKMIEANMAKDEATEVQFLKCDDAVMAVHGITSN